MTQFERPVFIGGLDRSGKTPLRAILDASHQIAFARRTYLWTRLRGRCADLVDPVSRRECFDALRAHSELASLGVDLGRVESDLLAGTPTFAGLVAHIGAQIAERSERPRWGLQEGRLEDVGDEVLEAFPRGRIVILVRDPRDRHFAARRLRLDVLVDSATRWHRSVSTAHRLLDRWPTRVLLLRYEDLVRDPAPAVRRVCTFIDEPDADRLADVAEQWFSNAPDPYDVRHIGDGGRHLPAWQLSYLQTRLAVDMSALGYADVPVERSVGTRIRAATAGPAAAALRLPRWVAGRVGRRTLPLH
jgi:hypothetical protein